MDKLTELLRDRQQGRSLRTLRDNAARRGQVIGHATIGLYLGDSHPVPTEETLRALAAAFGVSLKKLREAAGMGTVTTPFRLPADADKLTERQRRAVAEVVRAMLNPGGDPDPVAVATRTVDVGSLGDGSDDEQNAVDAPGPARRSGPAGRTREPRQRRS